MGYSRRFSLLGLVCLLAGCGLAPQLASSTVAPTTAEDALSGAYLALTYTPTPEIADWASRLRADLHFVGMRHAVPPRDSDDLHVTVGYFQKLERSDAAQIAEHFRNRNAEIQVTGAGTAKGQVAFFTVEGLELARTQLHDLKVTFAADDPHSTFGVSPANPHDVHGVPKKAQRPLGPYRVTAQYHLMQGTHRIW